MIFTSPIYIQCVHIIQKSHNLLFNAPSLLILHISKAEALLLASLPQPTFYAVSHSGPGSGWSYSHGAACPKPPQPQTPTPLSFVIKWGNRLIFSESIFY